MASCSSIHGSPVGAFKHDLRERDVYRNEDIDPLKSYLNYTLSEHGETSRECMDYFDSLLKNVYHREGSTVTSAEWSIQAPPDLESGREAEFFKTTCEFLNHYHFRGDDSRCILAEVHRDEIGADHLHYVFTFPEMVNEKFVEFNDKFKSGAEQVQEKFDIELTREQLKDCYSALQRYEARSDKARERETIQEFGRVLDLKRDDARWAFTRMRRLDSERFEKKLMPKDQFLTPEVFRDFHKSYQAWLDAHGFECTVYKGGGGISLSVEQLKEITRQTGVTLDHGLSVDSLSHLINENARLTERVAELEKQIELSSERAWGDSSGWGRGKQEERTWTR